MLRPTIALLTTIGTVLFAGLAAQIALGLTNGVPPVHVVIIGWLTAAYSLSGLVAWRCRPELRFGPLMVLTGISSLVSTLSWADNPVLHTIGQAADVVPLVLIVHVFVTFPTGRLRGRFEKVLIGAGYVASIGVQLIAMMLGALQPQVITVVDREPLGTLLFQA
ncbi:MAG TPA: hypothetical protein VFR35_03530, partial [Actinoplanes sp.]|nr:hypothetical protein [Actinoplanes sp.]